MSNQARWSEYEKLILLEVYNSRRWYRVPSLAAAYNRQITQQGYNSRSEDDVKSQIQLLRAIQGLDWTSPELTPESSKYLTPARVIRVRW